MVKEKCRRCGGAMVLLGNSTIELECSQCGSRKVSPPPMAAKEVAVQADGYNHPLVRVVDSLGYDEK